MSGLLEWVKNIACVLLFLSLVLHLFPNDKYERYVKIFLGMMTVYVVFQPLAQALSFETYLEQYIYDYWELSNETEPFFLPDAEALSYEVAASEYGEVLKRELTAFINEEGYEVRELELSINKEPEKDYGTVSSVRLFLSETSAKEDSVFEEESEEILVAPIVIHSGIELTSLRKTQGDEQEQLLKKKISEKFHIRQESVVITFQEAAYE